MLHRVLIRFLVQQDLLQRIVLLSQWQLALAHACLLAWFLVQKNRENHYARKKFLKSEKNNNSNNNNNNNNNNKNNNNKNENNNLLLYDPHVFLMFYK